MIFPWAAISPGPKPYSVSRARRASVWVGQAQPVAHQRRKKDRTRESNQQRQTQGQTDPDREGAQALFHGASHLHRSCRVTVSQNWRRYMLRLLSLGDVIAEQGAGGIIAPEGHIGVAAGLLQGDGS